MNRKLLTTLCAGLLLTLSATAVGLAVSNQNIINPSAEDTRYNLKIENIDQIKNDNGKLYVETANLKNRVYLNTTGTVAAKEEGGLFKLTKGQYFENLKNEEKYGIGDIAKINVTYAVGNNDNYISDSTHPSVLDLECGYFANPDFRDTVIYSAKENFGNNYDFSVEGKYKPSFVKLTSISDESVLIKSIQVEYLCTSNTNANHLAEPGLYVVGQGSFLTNKKVPWSLWGGVKLNHQSDWGGQNVAEIQMKKGDKFSFLNQNGWYSFNYKAGESEYYKHDDANHNVEILKDAKIKISLKDDSNDLYLERLKDEFVGGEVSITVPNHDQLSTLHVYAWAMHKNGKGDNFVDVTRVGDTNSYKATFTNEIKGVLLVLSDANDIANVNWDNVKFKTNDILFDGQIKTYTAEKWMNK